MSESNQLEVESQVTIANRLVNGCLSDDRETTTTFLIEGRRRWWDVPLRLRGDEETASSLAFRRSSEATLPLACVVAVDGRGPAIVV
jgi:hypothetical protein